MFLYSKGVITNTAHSLLNSIFTITTSGERVMPNTIPHITQEDIDYFKIKLSLEHNLNAKKRIQLQIITLETIIKEQYDNSICSRW